MIARWNLARFAETLLPLIDDTEPNRAVAAATEVIDGFMPRYEALWLSGVRAKLGLQVAPTANDEDRSLAQDWLDLLEQHSVDFTLGWRRLTDAAEGKPQLLEDLFPSADVPRSWLERWHRRVGRHDASTTVESMRAMTPVYIPRNHLVEEAWRQRQIKLTFPCSSGSSTS